jgi:hypothetical protein
MNKTAQFSSFGGYNPGPTLGTLEHKIMMDSRLDQWERQFIMRRLRQEVRGASSSTPLSEILHKIGRSGAAGGVLGFMVAKYFSMSFPGQVIATAAGWGIGKVLGDFYKATTDTLTGRNQQHRIRSLL